jgi:hypothetical protein
MVDIGGCGGYGRCCGSRGSVGSGAGGPAVGDLLGLMQGIEPSLLLVNPHAYFPEFVVFFGDAINTCSHGLQDRRVDSLAEAKSKEREISFWVHPHFADSHFPMVHEGVDGLVALFHCLKASLGLEDLVLVLELSFEMGLEQLPHGPFVVVDKLFNQSGGP